MLGAYAAFVGSTPTEVEIFISIMSPLWSKKTSVAATDERNIIILHRNIIFEFAGQNMFVNSVRHSFLCNNCFNKHVNHKVDCINS